MDARGHADSGVWEPGTERVHQIRQRSGSPNGDNQTLINQKSQEFSADTEESLAGQAMTFHSLAPTPDES